VIATLLGGSGRCYLRYLALQIVRKTDTVNKHDHDVTNDTVLRQTYQRYSFQGSVLVVIRE